MIKKVKYFIAITVLTVVAVLFLIVSAALFSLALRALKSGGASGAFSGLITLLFFFMSIGVSAVLALIALPFTITSVKKSENKTYPIIMLIIQSIIIIIGIILIILLIKNK